MDNPKIIKSTISYKLLMIIGSLGFIAFGAAGLFELLLLEQ